MKKFTDLNNTEVSNKVEQSKSKKELIGNIVEESLRIENGAIVGKDLLVDTFNRMIEINDHKTAIQVLESIKSVTYKNGFDFNMINESIENEKSLMNKPTELIVESVEEVIDNKIILMNELRELVLESNEDDIIKESFDVLNESAEWGELAQILLGASGVFLSASVITNVLNKLRNGNFGKKGKKMEDALVQLKNLVEEEKVEDKLESEDKPEVEGKPETEKEKEEVKESIFLNGYTDEYTSELKSLNSIYENIRNTKK